MIAIYDNGESYSAHETVFVEVTDEAEAEALLLAAKRLRHSWDGASIMAVAERIEWRVGASLTVAEAIRNIGDCFMPEMEDDLVAFDAVPIAWLDRIAKALDATCSTADREMWATYVVGRRAVEAGVGT